MQSASPKVALVTGASGSLGKALSLKLLENGFKVIGFCRSNPEISHEFFSWFVYNENDAKASIQLLELSLQSASISSIDLLVHNAALLLAEDEINGHEISLFNRMIQANIWLPYALSYALRPWLARSEDGHIIYIGSMAGYQGSRKYRNLSLYGATKAAGHALMEQFAVQWAEYGIRCNAVAMGAFSSSMQAKAHPSNNQIATAGQAAEAIWELIQLPKPLFNGKILPLSAGDP